MSNKKLVIVGDGETAEMAYEYFTHDSAYDVVAFSVEKEYAKKEKLAGLPVVHFEELEKLYPVATHDVIREMKRYGYECKSLGPGGVQSPLVEHLSDNVINVVFAKVSN